MKIIKNTSGRDTAYIKSVFTKVHTYMRTLEKRKAPNWKNLRVKINGREEKYHSGRAYIGGRGGEWDVFLTLPRPVKNGTAWHSEDKKGQPMFYGTHSLASLVYHELMHTYGYKHSQYNDISEKELNKLFPEVIDLPPAIDKVKAAALPKWQAKYDSALKRRKVWQAKAKRAANALKKVEKQIAYYERTYAID